MEPVIDYVQVGGKISGDSICASYLENTSGSVVEQKIEKNKDMLSIVVLMKEIALDDSVFMPIRIGCLRKYIEHTIKDSKDNSPAYNILSSLIHGRPFASYDVEGNKPLSSEDLSNGTNEIKMYFPNFDYNSVLSDLNENKLIALFKSEQNNYFKLLILRAYIEINSEARERIKKYNDILRKYTDETYHVENDYIYSLDVRKFNIVPQQYSKAAEAFIESESHLQH